MRLSGWFITDYWLLLDYWLLKTKKEKIGDYKMNELKEFKNLFEEEIKKNIILILEELTKELKKEEEKKNDNIDNN